MPARIHTRFNARLEFISCESVTGIRVADAEHRGGPAPSRVARNRHPRTIEMALKLRHSRLDATARSGKHDGAKGDNRSRRIDGYVGRGADEGVVTSVHGVRFCLASPDQFAMR